MSAADAQAAVSQGNASKAAGDLQRAAECYRQALQASPSHEAALYNLGLVLHEMNELQEAEAAFARLRALAPGDVEALAHLGAIQTRRGRLGEAIETLRAARRLAPADAGVSAWLERAYDGQGGAYLAQERLEEAIAHYLGALEDLDGARLRNGLGCALLLRGRVDEALEQLRRAVALDPELAGAQHNLGNAYSLKGEALSAIEAFQAALAQRPHDAAVREGLLFEMQNVCDWSRFDELCRLQRAAAVDPAQNVSPFSLLSIPSTPAEQLACARNWGRRQAARAAAGGAAPFRFAPGPRERLRIGYLSADFHDHVTAYVMAEMLELHDRRRVECIAYSYGPDDASSMRARIVRSFDRFVDVAPLGDAAAAAAIHADGVDILVDLKGYTQHARTGIMALRPAPVQVNYIGYPGTMAADFIDYFVVDRRVVPPGREADHGEQLVYMPSVYFAMDNLRPRPPALTRAQCGLPAEGFVYCCFNQSYKILPDVFAAWMRLLAAMPGSVLWLLETNRWVADNLRREAQRAGIDPARLVFGARLSSEAHLARLAAADLVLDTRPYNAHTTAADALWMGVPVLSWPGETFASRVAGSLLASLGLHEMIAGSAQEYEALALALARDPARLERQRAQLRRAWTSAPFYDTRTYMRQLETAYERMWQNLLDGRGPRPIEL